MNFSFLNPFSPPYPGTPFWGGGAGGGGGCRGGVKTSLRILGVVCGFGPRSGATFFLYMDPVTHGGGPGSELRVPPVATPHGPLLVRTWPYSRWIRLFSDTCQPTTPHYTPPAHASSAAAASSASDGEPRGGGGGRRGSGGGGFVIGARPRRGLGGSKPPRCRVPQGRGQGRLWLLPGVPHAIYSWMLPIIV